MSDKSEKTVPVSMFGQAFKDARKDRQLTQDDLGALLGVTRSTIAMIETGKMAAFDDDERYEKVAEQLGKTAEHWRRLAEQSKRTFHLTGEVTEEHRRTGDVLSRHWSNLPANVLRAIRQVVLNEVGDEGAPPAAPPPKKTRQ